MHLPACMCLKSIQATKAHTYKTPRHPDKNIYTQPQREFILCDLRLQLEQFSAGVENASARDVTQTLANQI